MRLHLAHYSRENSLKRLKFQGAAWREEREVEYAWRARFLEESRARKPRQQATINAGPYCWDKHLILGTFSKERYSKKCWYLLLKFAQSSRMILGAFSKERYSNECWYLLLKRAQSSRQILGTFLKEKYSHKCWYLLLWMFAAYMSTASWLWSENEISTVGF